MVLKKNHKDLLRYFPGDPIHYKIEDLNKWQKGKVDAIGTDYVIINGSRFNFTDIKKLRRYRKNFNYYESSGNLIIAGFIFPVIFGINNLIQNDKTSMRSAAATGAGLIVSGLIMKKLAVRNYKTGNRRYLKAMQ